MSQECFHITGKCRSSSQVYFLFWRTQLSNRFQKFLLKFCDKIKTARTQFLCLDEKHFLFVYDIWVCTEEARGRERESGLCIANRRRGSVKNVLWWKTRKTKLNRPKKKVKERFYFEEQNMQLLRIINDSPWMISNKGLLFIVLKVLFSFFFSTTSSFSYYWVGLIRNRQHKNIRL